LQTINLIPRKPWIEENAIKAIVTMSILVIALILIQLIVVGNLSNNTNYSEEKFKQIDNQIAVQSKKRLPNSIMSRVTQLRGETDKIIRSRINWLPIFANLIGTLPTDSRLSSMEISDDKLISISLTFDDDLEIIDYVKQLQVSTLFNHVTINKLVYVAPEVHEPTINSNNTPNTSDELFIPDDEDTILRKELQQLLENLSQPLDDAFIVSDSPFLSEDSPFGLKDLKLPQRVNESDEAEQQLEQELPNKPYFLLVVLIQL
jgi:hypothetical protein